MGVFTWSKLRAWLAECGAAYCVHDAKDLSIPSPEPVSIAVNRRVPARTADREQVLRGPSRRS